MSPLRNISAKVLVPLILVVPVVVISTLLVLIAARQSQSMSQDLGGDVMSEIRRRVGERLDVLLQEPRRVARLNALMSERGSLRPEEPRSMILGFIDQSLAHPEISSISWGGADGRAMWIARYTGTNGLKLGIVDERTSWALHLYPITVAGAIPIEPASSSAYDLDTRVWYASARDAGRPTWTPPYVWAGQNGSARPTLGIGYNAPHFDDDGALLGVFNAEFSLARLSDFLRSIELPEGAAVIVVTSDGTLVASTTEAPVAEAGETVLAQEASVELIRASAPVLGGLGAERVGEQRRLRVGGELYWLDAARFVSDDGIDWVIATAVPDRALMADVYAARRQSTTIAGVAIVLTMGLGVVLGWAVLRPLRRIGRHAESIGAGSFDARIAFRTTPELRALAEALNRMAEDLHDRYEIRRSLALASDVQRALLPSDQPATNGLDVHGSSKYCDETGGDYYDFLEVVGIDDQATLVVVGDVMGHGIAAAMLMATARGMLRSHALSSGSLAGLLTHVNALLAVDTNGERFMTMQLIALVPGQRSLRWASAGHGPPIIYEPAGDRFLELDIEGGGLPLGILEDSEYEEHLLEDLPLGTIIVSATDGVWEAMNPEGEQFGTERVCSLIRDMHRSSARSIADALSQAVHEHLADTTHDDDVTLVVVRLVETEEAPSGS